MGKSEQISKSPNIDNIFQLAKWANQMIEYFKSILKNMQFSDNLFGILVNPFWMCRRELYKTLKDFSSEITGTVLDFGCGSQPYRKLFNYSKEYIGLEYDTPINRQTKRANIFYDGTHIPLGNDEVDSIVSTQTIEHVPNPEVIIREWSRVLKIGGSLLCTVPFIWPEHEMPYDHQRYTTIGIRRVLERHGFVIIEQRRSLRGYKAIGQLLIAYIYDGLMQENSGKIKRWGMYLISFVIATLSTIASMIFPENSNTYLDNVVFARLDAK